MGVFILCVVCVGIFLIMRAGDNVFGELFSMSIIFIAGATIVVGFLIILGAVLIPAVLTLAAIWFCCKRGFEALLSSSDEIRHPKEIRKELR